jgi:hypothetical protein
MRRGLVIVPMVLSTLIVLAFWATADRPLHARQAGSAWEYGSLEIVSTGRGMAYVFCQFTAQGCAETELDIRPTTERRFPPMSTDKALSSADAAAARAIARLGRDGWELVNETGFARFGSDERVLMFKRPAR